MLLLVLFFLVVSFYAAALLFLLWQWHQIPPVPAQDARGNTPFLSVVVVVRNEALNLPQLFGALMQQSLAADQFELHLVDDASTDQTVALIQDFRSVAPFCVQLHVLNRRREGHSPKKEAIQQVLPLLQGDVVVVTDGDCQPAADWLLHLQRLWQAKAPVFVSGPVRYMQEHSGFERLQSIDFAALIGVGAAMLQAGSPGMCNAANMAFCKKTFLEVGGYKGNEHVPSGDDEFLLQKLASAYPHRLFFLKSAGALVSTRACRSWYQFVQQRKRWAGKWRLHQGLSAKALAVGVFLFYLLLVICLAGPFLHPSFALAFVLVWLLKALADYLFLYSILHFMKKRLQLKSFLLLELVYPFYVLFFAVAATTGRFTWKDRSYRYTTAAHE